MPTITPVIRSSKKNAQGLYPVYLRIADTGGSRYNSLGVAIKKADWNPKPGVARKGCDEHEAINAIISMAVAKAKAEVYRRLNANETITAADLKEALVPESARTAPLDFWAFADEVVDGYQARGQIWSYDRFRSVMKKFRAFTGEPFLFSGLTPALLRQYEDHLIVSYKNKTNTVATAMKAISTVVRRAVVERHIAFADNPFHQHRIKQEQTERVRLTIKEVRTIEALDLRSGSIEAVARDCWLFAFYSGGPRISDVIQTRWRSVAGGRHDYRMSKNGKAGALDLVPQARAVLARYSLSNQESDPEAFVFPLLKGRDLSTPSKMKRAIQSSTAQINLALKAVAKAVKLKKNLTSHVARHSWADLARQGGWDVYSISKVLRHSNLKITERYLATFDEEALSQKMQGMFGGEP